MPSFSNIHGHSNNHGLSFTPGFATTVTTTLTITITASTGTIEIMRNATLPAAFPATSSTETPSRLTLNFNHRSTDPFFVSPIIDLSEPPPGFSDITKSQFHIPRYPFERVKNTPWENVTNIPNAIRNSTRLPGNGLPPTPTNNDLRRQINFDIPLPLASTPTHLVNLAPV